MDALHATAGNRSWVPHNSFYENPSLDILITHSLLVLILCHHRLKIQVSEGFRHLMSMGAQHHRESEPR